MIDRKKVIRELRAARLFFEMWSNRADGVVGNLGCKSGIEYIDDATELLKEESSLKMTNKEWLATLSAEEWYQTIHWLYHVYGKRWTDTRLAILDWLEEEHTEKKK